MIPRKLRDCLTPVFTATDLTTLRDIRDHIRKGRIISFEKEREWYILPPELATGYPLTRRIIDLPLLKSSVIPIHMQIVDAFHFMKKHNLHYILVEDEGKIVGALSLEEALDAIREELMKKALLTETLIDIVEHSNMLFFRLTFHKENERYELKDFEYFGPIKTFLGFDEAEVNKNPNTILNRIVSEDVQKHAFFAKQLVTHFEEKKFHQVEYRYLHPQKGLRWFRERAALFYDQSHTTYYVYGFLTDITEQKRESIRRDFEHEILALSLFYKHPVIFQKFFNILARYIPFDVGVLLVVSKDGQFEIAAFWPDEKAQPIKNQLFQNLQTHNIVSKNADAPLTIVRERYTNLEHILRNNDIVFCDEIESLHSPVREVLLSLDLSKALIIPVGTVQDQHLFIKLGMRSSQNLDNIHDQLLRLPIGVIQSTLRSWWYQKKLHDLMSTLEERVQEKTYELETMYSLAQQLGYALNYQDLFQTVRANLHRIMAYDITGLLIFRDTKGEFYIHPEREITQNVIQTIVEKSKKLCETLINKTLSFEFACVEQPKSQKPEKLVSLGSLIFVPMFIMPERDIVGILFVGSEHKHAFTNKQLRILHTVVHHASLSVARIQAIVRGERLYMETVVNSVHDGLILLDQSDRLIMANPAGQSFINHHARMDQDNRLVSFGNIPFPEILEKSIHLPYEIILEQKEEKVYSIHTTKIVSGQFAGGHVLTIPDVTREKEIEEKARLQSRLAAIGQLSAGIAHDLNNMLTPIYGFSDLLIQREDLPSDVKEYLTMIADQAQSASNIIRKILDFSRTSLQQKKVVNLYPYIKEIVKMLERALSSRIHVSFQAYGEEFLILADPASLQDVIMNLAINARDAMPHGGELSFTLSIKKFDTSTSPFREMADQTWVCLEVKDSGKGIQPEHLPHIFEPFFTTKERGKGTGLGLAQVYGIIKSHGGYIDVKSIPGKGTTFFIFLPLVDAIEEQTPKTFSHVAQPSLKQTTILLVDDREDVRKSVKMMLECPGCTVLDAENAEQAFELFLAHKDVIDLLIVDWGLPNQTGTEFIKKVRSNIRFVPAVLMSGYIKENYMDELEHLENVYVLQKPFNQRELIQALNEVLHRNDTSHKH